MSYNCQYIHYSIYFVSSDTLLMSYTVYHNNYVVTNAPCHRTILRRRYDIPFGYSDILSMIDNKHEL